MHSDVTRPNSCASSKIKAETLRESRVKTEVEPRARHFVQDQGRSRQRECRGRSETKTGRKRKYASRLHRGKAATSRMFAIFTYFIL